MFAWEDLVERNKNELVTTWGNLGNRMLSFACKRFDGRVPQPGALDDEDRALLEKAEAGFETMGALFVGLVGTLLDSSGTRLHREHCEE